MTIEKDMESKCNKMHCMHPISTPLHLNPSSIPAKLKFFTFSIFHQFFITIIFLGKQHYPSPQSIPCCCCFLLSIVVFSCHYCLPLFAIVLCRCHCLLSMPLFLLLFLLLYAIVVIVVVSVVIFIVVCHYCCHHLLALSLLLFAVCFLLSLLSSLFAVVVACGGRQGGSCSCSWE